MEILSFRIVKANDAMANDSSNLELKGFTNVFSLFALHLLDSILLTAFALPTPPDHQFQITPFATQTCCVGGASAKVSRPSSNPLSSNNILFRTELDNTGSLRKLAEIPQTVERSCMVKIGAIHG